MVLMNVEKAAQFLLGRGFAPALGKCWCWNEPVGYRLPEHDLDRRFCSPDGTIAVRCTPAGFCVDSDAGSREEAVELESELAKF